MSTLIRPEVSQKNKYWISKHRHYELKHFCLQYPEWKRAHEDALESCISAAKLEQMNASNVPSDITAKLAEKRAYYAEKIKLIENAVIEADESLYYYLLKAVTEGLSYTYLKTALDIPCSKDTYYDRYRRFFWILSNNRE